MCLELKFSIGDYEKWKQNFENNSELRKKYGSRGAIAFTDTEEKDQITVIIKAMTRASMAKAQESGEFQAAMQSAGITSDPQLRYMQYVKELDA